MENKKKYSYNDKVSEEKYSRDIIKLPIKSNGDIDFDYMETYISYTRNLVENLGEELLRISNYTAEKIDLSKFKRFHLYDKELFEINSGTKLDKVRMSNNNPTINFVGRSNANNGVTDFIDKIDGVEPYKAGYMTISLGGEYLGSCFIQDKPFYTSQNVNVLIPKKQITYYQKQFIATMVFREGRLHYKAFIDELNRHMKTDFTIPLPVKADDSIDWEYMEFYMRYVEEKVKIKINTLKYMFKCYVV